MKGNFLLIGLLFLSLVTFAETKDSIWISASNKQISINEAVKDFGVVNQNQKAMFKYALKNLEPEALVVWHVTSSCGCTTPQWTEKPVQQNDEAIIKVNYDSSKLGVFKKSVFVYTNFDDKPIELTIKGTVVCPKSESKITKESTGFKATVPKTN